MAGVLKFWRESSSLIIASKRFAMKQAKPTFINKLLKKDPIKVDNTNEELLRLLLLKRSSESSYLPDVHVFPGGMLESADFSKDWLEIFGNNGDVLNICNSSDQGSPIFSRKREPELLHVTSDVALRIAAIRETFEECGILLARPKSDLVENTFSNIHPSFSTVCSIPEVIASKWRRNISSDSSQFLVMCKELDLIPDVWSLYEWSNWLTPPLKGKRFDTAFFVSCIDETPEIIPSEESTYGMWMHPADVLKECSEGSLVLAPPQIYEMSRLVRLNTVDELLSFAWKRSSHRVDRWMPVVYSCSEGIIFALPGDDLYPDSPDLTGETSQVPIYRRETPDELLRLYPRQHRAVMDKNRRMTLYCNIEFIDGHILPYEYKKTLFPPKFSL